MSPSSNSTLLQYQLHSSVEAFSTRRDSSLPYSIIRPHQVHGTQIAIAERVADQLGKLPADLTREDLWGYDAIVTAVPNLAIAVRTADCIPVLLYDTKRHAIAAIHAGWRGTVAYIVSKTISLMHSEFGTNAADIVAVIGPGIAKASFQVGEEVVQQFRDAHFPMSLICEWQGEPVRCAASVVNPMAGGYHIDLFAANRWVLESAGVLTQNIHTCGIDTFLDTSFFSARREGTACGRIHSVIRVVRR
ncbi:MAG: peptidoglycan editing factor PgeF [Paludibacteraceae bacterium]|nr:peptidoglycan editing factor PgeF [Paludibacteraceae bacterium]